MPKYALRFVTLALALSVVGSFGCQPATAAARRKAPARGRQAAAPLSASALTDTARLLAGLPTDPSGPLGAVAAKPAWQAWQKEFDNQWTQATKERFAEMTAWRDKELAPATGTCSTLMYPFSGPDILNAIVLFPDCQRYILFGLEPVGSMPVLEQLPAERLTRLFEETRRALNDLLSRNYFITSHMMQDTAAQELRGTLPLMAVSLVRLNARLVSVREMEIAEDGELRPRTPPAKDRHVASAVELVFERPGHEPQTVVYFRAQAEDKAIPQRPGVVPYLQHQAPYATFLKSASYLLHGSDFTIIRNLLLHDSRLVLEDDSGIPYRYFRTDTWEVKLFGRYIGPVETFKKNRQPELMRAYGNVGAVPVLRFGLGYNRQPTRCNLQLALRRVPS